MEKSSELSQIAKKKAEEAVDREISLHPELQSQRENLLNNKAKLIEVELHKTHEAKSKELERD